MPDGRGQSRPALRAAAPEAEGFPPDSFTFQSEETLARDFEGSWFFAMR